MGELIFQWIGNIFIIGGLWGIGNKARKAFLLSIIGETMWIIASILSGTWALAFICTIFLLMAIRGYIKWVN